MENKNLPRVFVGSSFTSLIFAHALREALIDTAELITWDDYFYSNRNNDFNFYNIIQSALEDFHYAVFFISSDRELSDAEEGIVKSKEKIKQTTYVTVENVWLEIGMFLGRYSKSNVLLVKENRVNIVMPSDLSGYEFHTFKAPQDHYDQNHGFSYLSFLNKNDRCDWGEVGRDKREAYLNSIQDAVEGVKKIINYKPNDIRPMIIRSSDVCYEKAKRMINEASIDIHVHTILAFEGEPIRDGSNRTLWPEIKSRIERTKQYYCEENGVSSYDKLDNNIKKQCQDYCKSRNFRWINLHGGTLYEQAKEILGNHAEFITIKDTHCKYVEIVLVKNEALVLFPSKVRGHIETSYGIYINDEALCKDLESWFHEFARERLDIEIDNLEKLESYRNLHWPASKRSNEFSCHACLRELSSISDEFRNELKKTGLYPG